MRTPLGLLLAVVFVTAFLACIGGESVVGGPVAHVDDALHVAPGGEDHPASGPASFDVTERARLVLDSVAGEVVITPRDGGASQRIALGEDSAGAIDIAAFGSRFAILRRAETRAEVVIFDGGRVTQRWPIESTFSATPSGVSAVDGGAIVVEAEGGARLLKLDPDTGTTQVVGAYELGGHRIAARPGEFLGDQRRGSVQIDSQVFPIASENFLAGLEVLAVDHHGDVWVRQTEARISPSVAVRVTVRVYAPGGSLRGWAEVAQDDVAAAPHRDVRVAPDGTAIAMRVTASGVEVRGLVLQSAASAPSDALAGEMVVMLEPEPPTRLLEGFSCIRPAQVMTNAVEYLSYSTNYPETAVANDCRGCTRPVWLTRAGRYTSVAYSWGGSDSPAEYGAAISRGARVGDVDRTTTTCQNGRPSGVDCAGFVARVWGLGLDAADAAYTGNLESSYATRLCSGNLCRVPVAGDAWNKAGDHVVLFAGGASGGIQVYEATGESALGRVVARYLPWSRLNGYVALRYRSLCP